MTRRFTFSLLALLMIVAAVAGCGGAATTTPKADPKPAAQTAPQAKQTTYPLTLKDATGRDVTIPAEPKRVVSVAPSNTELVFALGKGSVLVGRSDFDDYPAEAAKIPSVGGWIPPNYELIVTAKPDLVLVIGGSDEARNKLINDYKLNLFVVDSQTFDQVYADTKKVGQILNAQEAADQLVADMQAAVKEVTDQVAKATNKPKVYYEVWDEPLMSAGAGTFIQEMITLAGGVNVAADLKGWANINAEAVAKANPDVIIASSADDLKKIQGRQAWSSFKAVQEQKIFAIGDPNTIVRPGPRLIQGLKWFARTIHPELFK